MAKKSSRKSIVKHKKAEDTLKESEEKFRILAEQSPNMIFINKKGRIVYANKKCEEITGYKKHEFYSPGFNFLRLIAQESRKLTKKSFRKHMQGKEVPPYEYTLITKAGKRIEVIHASKLIKYDDETAILGIETDITKQKKTQEAILRANMLNSALVENAPFGIFTVNKKGIVDYVNPAMLNISGDKKGEFMGMNVFKLPTYVKLGLAKKLKECFKGKPFFVGPLEYISYYSKKRSIRNFTGLPMQDEKGRVDKVMVFVEDITKIKEIEEQLKKRAEEFERFHKLAVGRELRMVELKKRIKELEGKLKKRK